MTQILSARSIAVYVTAIEMTRQEYNEIRGWELPADENGDDEGFLIEDPAGQKNTPDYDGFVQWLPKAEFERKFTVDDDACCEEEPKCADSTMGMNAVSPSCSLREDVYMLTEIIKVAQSGPEREPAMVAARALTKLINEMFPDEKKADAQAEQPSTPKARVEQERAELGAKLVNLKKFLSCNKPEFISQEHWNLLNEQQEHMDKYYDILEQRLEMF